MEQVTMRRVNFNYFKTSPQGPLRSRFKILDYLFYLVNSKLQRRRRVFVYWNGAGRINFIPATFCGR